MAARSISRSRSADDLVGVQGREDSRAQPAGPGPRPQTTTCSVVPSTAPRRRNRESRFSRLPEHGVLDAFAWLDSVGLARARIAANLSGYVSAGAFKGADYYDDDFLDLYYVETCRSWNEEDQGCC